MPMTDHEFISTNPLTITEISAISVDVPNDQPPFIGLVLRHASSGNPRHTVQLTFRLDPTSALDLATELQVVALPLT